MSKPNDYNLAEVLLEYNRATDMYDKLNSPHEGFAVLAEEVDELWDEVKSNPRKDPAATSEADGIMRRKARMREEAIQVAAMALRFLEDCT